MKKTALLTLGIYLSVAFAPLGFAFDFSTVDWADESNQCPDVVENNIDAIITDDDIESEDLEAEEPAEGEEEEEPAEEAPAEEPEEEEITEDDIDFRNPDEADEINFAPHSSSGLTDEAINQLELREKKMGEIRKEGGDICGKPNNVTEYLEKGDCTATGAVVTEISEIIGPAIADDGNGNQIIDVYKGTCCLIVNTSDGEFHSCKDKRSIYALDKPSCDEFSPFCEKRQWIISSTGAGIIKIYVKQLYIWAAGTIGFISVVTLVISGIQISVSGVSGDITAAKDRIIKVFVGLVLLFFSGVLLYTVNPTFFS